MISRRLRRLWRLRRLARHVFEDDREDAVIEGLPRRFRDADDPFTLADAFELDRAVVAVRVIAGFTQRDEARPGAAAHALFGVVASLAVAPEIARRPVARIAKGFAPLPDVHERRIADVAAGPRRGRKRGAALDGAVGFDAQRGPARAARAAVAAVVVPAKHRLVRPEVADVVPRPHADAELVAPLLQRGEQRKECQEIVRLEQDLRLVGRAPHGHRELDLPRLHTRGRDGLEDVAQDRHREAVDLRVAREAHALLANGLHRLETRAVRSDDPAQAIVRRLVAVDRDARPHEPRGLGLRDDLRGEPAAARGGGADHAARANGADDVEPVVAEVRLAPDERHLF